METGTAGYGLKCWYDGSIITQTALTELVGFGCGSLMPVTDSFGFVFNINGGKVIGNALDDITKLYVKVTFGIVFDFGNNKVTDPD